MANRLTRFSLRTLLIGIAAGCCFLAYEGNWVHGRRQFLAEQRAKGTYSEAMRSRWLSRTSVNNVSRPAEGAYRRAPCCLGWFGEKGYHHVAIIIRRSDTVTRRLGVGTDTLDTLSNHPDYMRAQSLFPEATIYPCVVNGSEVYDVNVKDSVTGKVITGQVYWGDDVWDETMQRALDALRARLATR